MSWLQRRPQVSSTIRINSVGLSKTILVVGLGNPESKYLATRHNVGYKCLDFFTDNLEEFDNWLAKKDLKCVIRTAQLADKRVIAVKPLTAMNISGEAVSLITNFYKIDPTSLIVVHDELDISFGQIRTRIGGSDAGHNGIKSVTKSLGTEDYGRIRIGIGPKKPDYVDSKDFVLQKFSDEEAKYLPDLYKETSAVLSEYIYGDSGLSSETRSFII